MKIARYWTRAPGEAIGSGGERVRVTARGWSDSDLDSARQRAQDIARRVAQRIAARPEDAPRYPYGDRPLPEPILSEFRDGDTLSAVITRNSYGALVMNADQMMFVDIDRAPASAAPHADLRSLFSGLFGKPAPKAADPVVEDIGRVASLHGLSMRVYRTAAGYRGLITDRHFHANASDADALLKEFGADTLYMRLCRTQESFRARLTPKPWRIGVRKPPGEFPFETPGDEARYREWQREYDAAAQGYATCAYLAAFGSERVRPEFEKLVRFHDETTKASSGLHLA